MSIITASVASNLVRAVVPLPDGYQWNPRACPLTLETVDGRTLPTQWECVALAPNNQDVRLAELIAYDEHASNSQLLVRPGPQRDSRVKLTAWARSLLSTPPVIEDGFTTHTTQFAPNWYRDGSIAATRRFYSRNFVGWLTVYAGCNFAECFIKVHNAAPQSPPWLFNYLRVVGLPGVFTSGLPEPLVHDEYLVTTHPGGLAHALPQRTQREYRLVIVGPDDGGSGSAYAAGAGFGVSDQWTECGAWGPEQLALPHLPANTRAGIASYLRGERARIVNALATGAAIDVGAGLQAGRIGIGHTTGSHYGGMTGGSGRWLFDEYGPMIAMTGEAAGLHALQGKAAMLALRMQALIEPDGHVCTLDAWRDAQGAPLGNWQMSSASSQFERQGSEGGKLDGAFGFYARRNQFPAGVAYDAAEYALLEDYVSPSIAEIDFQHYVRAVAAHASLAMLSHDPLAEHTLRGLAESHRMSMFTQNRLGSESSWVAANPGFGTGWGRAHGHGYSAQAFAYYLSGRAWRDARRSELDKVLNTVCLAQMPNGCLQSMRGNKEWSGAIFQSQHAIAKGTEQAILAHMTHQLDRVLGGSDVTSDAMLVRLARDGFGAFHRAALQSAPFDWVATQPNAPRTATPYATPPVTNWHDRTEVAVVYGLALLAARRLGVNPSAILAVVKRHCGNAPDSRAWLLAQNKLDLDDTLALLRALE